MKWTLRAGAIAFGASAALAFAGSMLGPFLYSAVGLLTAGVFVIVGIWELTNSQGYFSGIPPILLFIFAAWNGYGSWMGLQEVLSRRSASPQQQSSLL